MFRGDNSDPMSIHVKEHRGKTDEMCVFCNIQRIAEAAEDIAQTVREFVDTHNPMVDVK